MVLDSWAVIAWLKGQQPAADRVDGYFRESFAGALRLSISVLNLGEIYCVTAKHRDLAIAASVLEALQDYQVAVLPSPNDLVMAAARLKARWPLSYADAFAAATALHRNERLITGDPELRPLATGEGLLLDWIGEP